MIVNYEFEIDQMVITPFGRVGIISMLGFDEVGNQYFVKSQSTSDWFKEKSLKEYNPKLSDAPDETVIPPSVEYQKGV